MSYREDLDKLIIWAESRGYMVDISPSGDNSVDKESKIISISSRRDIRYQVCVLLHECGHVQIFDNSGTMDMDDLTSKGGKNSRKRKTAVLIEEVEAWRRAINLSKKLNISVETEYIKSCMINAILKYAKWC